MYYELNKLDSIYSLYTIYKNQGKRREDYNAMKLISDMFCISERTLSRYLRLHDLYFGFKVMWIEGRISLRTGVELSYLNCELQETIFRKVLDNRYKVTYDNIKFLKEISANSRLTSEVVDSILGIASNN